MSDPAFALQAAIFARLSEDAALTALTGEGRIHDAPPRAAALPFVALGRWRVRPLDAAGGVAHEHRLELVARTAAGGRREASAIADRVVAALTEAPLSPDGHRVATLGLVERTSGEARDRRSFEAVAVLRAVTEPAG
jgi:hypothetical protein